MKKNTKRPWYGVLSLKPDLKMRLTYFFLFLCFFQVKANTFAQDTKVSLDVKGETLKQVFELIESQTDFRFFFSEKEIDLNKRISLSAQEEELSSVLPKMSEDTSYEFKIFNQQIIISPAAESPVRLNNNAQQKYEITGRVTDQDGNPLYGVAVIEESSNIGTGTDENGEYLLEVQDLDQTLIFSYLGFKRLEEPIQGRIRIDIVMTPQVSDLDEVVLIGYGTQEREDVSGAISSIDVEDVENIATGTIGFDRALGGLAKGVQVSQNTGRPGAPIRINIRGYTSPLSGGLNQPLFVINGVPFNMDALPGTFSSGNNNPLLALNPEDIESIDILKDAAATSIYGSRGANGVIIIETKSGKKNQAPTINFSYNTTIAEPINTLKALDATQYRQFNDLLLRNSVEAVNNGRIPDFYGFDLMNFGDVELDFETFQYTYNGLLEERFGDANVNWNEEIYRDLAVTNQVNFGMSGGSDKTSYTFGLSGIDQEGLVINNEFKQYNARAAFNTEINSRITTGASFNLGHTKSDGGEDPLLGPTSVNSAVVTARPDFAVRDENGQLIPLPDFQYGFETFEPNPVAKLQNKNKSQNYNFLGNAFLEVEPLENLKLKGELTGAFFDSKNSVFIKGTSYTNFGFPNPSLLTTAASRTTNMTTNLTADYTLNFSDNSFNILGGFAWDRTKMESESYFFQGFPDDEVLINPGSAEEVLGYGNSEVESGINSFFSRLSYSYKNKYNATINFRSDASSKFGPGNRRGNFPSISASWNIANEDFLLESPTLNTLKLRVSAGEVGSANVANFAYLQFFSKRSQDLYGGNTAILASSTLPNRNIGWETTREVNVGLDFDLFDYRLRGSFDIYNRKTEGALAPTPVPLELGPSVYYSNLMDVSNKGVEISLGGEIIRTKDFQWSIDANWSYNRNVLEELHGANINQFSLDYYIEGEPVGTIKGYEVVKILQDQAEVDALNAASPSGLYDRSSLGVGDFMFRDVNGDGRITAEDRVKIGAIEPDFFGGFNTRFSYKNFSLSSFFQYSVGAESVWSALTLEPYNSFGPNKLAAYALDTWTPENTDARFAKALYTDPSGNSRLNDRTVFDTSYLRMKFLQLAYNFDKGLLEKLKIHNATVFISGSNLLTLTDWPGLDPESFSERGTITDQVNNEDPYPLAKSYSVGIKLNF